MTKTNRTNTPNICYAAQEGYLLIVVAVLLTILIVVSTQFLSHSVTDTRMAETTRDSARSLELAESAANLLYGYLSYGADLNADQIPDRDQASLNAARPPTSHVLPYLFYMTSGKGLDHSSPDILQRVANGEARLTGSPIKSQAIADSNTLLRVTNLFGPGFGPLLYTVNDGGDYVSSAKTWDEESADLKAAVWIEVVSGPGGSLYYYVESVGAAGDSHSYTQRFIGEITQSLGSSLGPLNQSS